ncbi:MAG: SusC/RagA family TonB-linked outer membrane protein [Methylococcaceae bacterium]|nr:SusC/RagA family TonB-linked outer membrane protein [Prolixibacteraceae bacterium]
MRKVLLLTVMCFVLIGSAIAQHSVSGTVVAESDGSGLPGVSVSEKGTGNGVLTDVNGKYSIKVGNENGTLVFSFVGMTTKEEPVNNRSVIDVRLSSKDIGLDEVVVTALGIKRETRKLGYGMTEVKGEELAIANTTNPVQALQGKSTGLSIGASDGGLFGNSKIQIRGVSVLNSNSNQPIFVVDGVIIDNAISNESADWAPSANDFGNQLKNLNPDDFESVSVLKGAASTALYGSRGMNGAIVIKTKDGAGSRGIGVQVTQSVGIDDVYRQPDIQYEYGTGAIAGYVDYGEKDANGNYYQFAPMTQYYTNDKGMMTKIGHPWQGTAYGPKFDGRDIEDYDGSITKYLPAKNNMRDAYDTGYNSNTSVSLSGGNDKGTFFLSDSYNMRKGTSPSNEFTRNALLFSGSYNLSKWLKADASISHTISTPKNPGNDLSEAFLDGNFENWYDTKKWNRREVYQSPLGGVPSSNYGDKYANVPNNGLWFNYHLNSNEREEQVTRPIVRLTAKIAPWISVTAEGNMNYYTTSSEVRELGQGYLNEGGYYSLGNTKDVSRTAKITANLNKDFGDFTTNLIVGGELWDQKKENTRVWTDGGLIVPGRYFLGNSQKTLLSEGSINGTKQINSVYALLNVGFKNQLYIDVTGRNDWSSALVYTNGTGNYSYFYPSVSTSWIANETLNLPSWVTLAKTRLSWAQVGNDTSPYFINNGYAIGSMEMEDGKFVYTNTKSTILVDTDVKPERKNSLEAGLDLRMFNNRIGVDFTVYDETINNQIGTIPLPVESGVDKMISNIGSLTNRGLELSVRLVPVKTREFSWESTVNYWRNTTMISNLRPEVGEYKTLGGDIAYGNFRVGSVAFEDGEYGVLMSDTKPLEWNNTADPNDPRNGMKVLTWNDTRRGAYYTRSGKAEVVGKIQPDFEGSWNNMVRFKNLSLTVLLDARFGGNIASYSNKYGTSYGYLETSLKGRDAEHGGLAWTTQYADSKGQNFVDGVIPDGVFAAGQKVTAPNGQSVDVGGLTYKEAMDKGYVEPTHASYFTYRNNAWSTGVINDDWFSEVNYIALRNVTLSYNLPVSLAKKMKAQSLQLALNARNLGYLYNSLPNHLNPESFRGTSSSDSFRERSFSPYTASYTMTLSVGF